MSDSKYGILFKTADELDSSKDPYLEKFEKAEIKCKIISVLKFEFINLGELKAKLSKCDDYSAIVLLSPRCVKAVKLSGEDMSKWKKHRIFVVGEKTAKLVESELGLQSEGSSSGNAKALAHFILQKNISKPLLVPTGNLSRDSLFNILTEGGIKLDQIIVYNTVPDQTAESHIKEAFEKHNVRYIMYFSPSAVDITFPIFNKLGIQLNNIKLGAIGLASENALLKHFRQNSINVDSVTSNNTQDWAAIGSTTEKALIDRSIAPSIVPESPTPQHFATALERSLNN